jgi:diguanylate cyclase (GGDEF)-like protein/putative nucleotidyltransferase with HDIG domain
MSSTIAPTFRTLPIAARLFIPGVLALAAAALVISALIVSGPPIDPALLAIAAALCAAGNLFEVFAPANFSFQPNLAVFFAAALLLPPWAVALLAAVCFLPGWLVHRFRWYMVAFNIGNYILAGLAAHVLVSTIGPLTSEDALAPSEVLGLAAASLAFVAINHLLIASVVSCARGRPLRRSVQDMLGGFPIELALALTGACLAVLWTFSPLFALLAAGPGLLIYRALWVPLLEHKSRTDPKTGLYNSEYLGGQIEDALASARNGDGHVSVVMIDLDQLRLINNRHGHLAGDELIRAVATVVAEVAGQHDGIAARFGGDELCVLLPDQPLESGRSVADVVRAQIEAVVLDIETSKAPLRITASIGVSAYPEHADTVQGLIAAADVAVYDAKLSGRNRSRVALSGAAREAVAMDSLRAPALARPPAILTEDVIPAPVPGEHDSGAGPPPTQTGPKVAASSRSARFIPWYVAMLCASAGGAALFFATGEITASPVLFAALVISVLVLDLVRIDVFERANLSPASIPELALAFFFGPLGPIAAEALIALARSARRDPVLKWAFDFGALSLAGTAAAAVFDAFPTQDPSTLLLLEAGLAGIAFYAVNSSLLSIVMGLSEGRLPGAVWRERFGWMAPHYVAFGLLAGMFVIAERELGGYAFALFGLPVLMLWIGEKQYLDRSRATVSELRGSNDELEAANKRLQGLLEENQELLGRMHRSYLSTITSLARTVEAKDPYTSGHTERVAEIAVLLAGELGISADELPAINVGAIIHDIGKVGVPDEILLKAGPLDPEELIEMRKHPEMSSYILAELDLPPAVKQMVRNHHERYDGMGYPDGLAGEEIPLAARILSVADAFDAMTSDRPYRNALPLETACAEIIDKSGSQFCPVVVDALIRAFKRGAVADPAATGESTGLDPATVPVS